VQMSSTFGVQQNGKLFTVKPLAPLNVGGTYQIILVGAKDLAGNTLYPDYMQALGFTTAASFALQSITPANGATGVTAGSTVSLTFNHAADPGTVLPGNASCSGTVWMSTDASFGTCLPFQPAAVS